MESRIVKINGSSMIEIDGKLFTPAMYRSFRPTPSNVALFHRSGVRLCQTLVSGRNSTAGVPYNNFGDVWVGKGKYDFANLDKQMKMFRRYAPDSYMLLMPILDMPQWWLDSHPGMPDSYFQILDAAQCQEWIDEATDFLKAFITYAEEKYGDWVFGYACSAGQATEWFDDTRYRSAGEARKAAYRKYVGDENAHIPTHAEVCEAEGNLLREPKSDVVQYMDFNAGITPNLICHFASAAQSVLHHKKIFGLFFGYTDTPNGEWQNRTATNGYEKVWASPDIDMLFSPAAYGEARDLQGASSYQYLVDSVAMNNKLYLHEIDHRTHLATYPLDNFAMYQGYETEFETTMVLRREICAAATKNGALWWFDFFGNYYATPDMEAEVAHELKVMEKVYQKPYKSTAEIAVFVDPMNYHIIKDGASSLTCEYVRFNRNSLHMCGAPYDYFNLNDLKRLDVSQYKMFVFLNSFRISDDVRRAIDEKLPGRMKVWIHAPNIASGEKLSQAAVEELIGMQLQQMEADSPLKIHFAGQEFGFTHPMKPMFRVTDADAESLACYQVGGVAVAQKGDQVYIGAGNVPRELWRELAKRAGVNIYTEEDGALYADSRMVAFQPHTAGKKIVKLPAGKPMEELFEGIPCEIVGAELHFEAEADHMYLFLEK